MPKISRLIFITITSVALNCTTLVMAETDSADSKKIVQNHRSERLVHTRSLAASCVVCHGVGTTDNNQNKMSSLAGMSALDISSKLQAFKSGELTATVMHHHAKGLSSEEIVELAEYFSAQSLRQPVSLPTQKLLENHAY